MSWWTTEQVAEYLDVTEQSVYDSRRRDRFPGNRGSRRGKRLMFPSEAIEAGRQAVEEGRDPDAPETTDDATQAILWALEGIHTTLRAIHNKLRRVDPKYMPVTMTADQFEATYGIDVRDLGEATITGNTITGDEEE